MSESKKIDAPNPLTGRRDVLRTLATGAFAVTAASSAGLAKAFAAPTGASGEQPSVIRAYKLYRGPDNASHVLKGTINQRVRTDVEAMHFKETPAHGAYDWHNDPEPQFVFTLSGTLEFTTRDGEKFVMRPGDVLIAEDNIGTGHKWRLIDDQPWRRAYVTLKQGAEDSFIPDSAD